MLGHVTGLPCVQKITPRVIALKKKTAESSAVSRRCERGSVGGWTMRCDDPGGLCAADQPHRAGSEQMREKEGDTRQKGAEWSASERRAVPYSSSSTQYRITASPVETRGMVQSNSRRCAAHPPRARYMCAHRGGGPPTCCSTKHWIHAPRPKLQTPPSLLPIYGTFRKCFAPKVKQNMASVFAPAAYKNKACTVVKKEDD